MGRFQFFSIPIPSTLIPILLGLKKEVIKA